MSTIDIEGLLNDIDPEAPSGESDLQDAGDPAWVALDIKMKGTPEQFDGNKIVQEAKDPNWAEVRDDAFKLLTRTHDLRVAVSLTQALIHCHGVQGLTDGLTLLHGLIARYWDTLYPSLDPEDDNDPTIRNTALEALSFGEDILGPLKKAELCASRALGRYGYRDILIASGKIELPAKESANVPGMTDIEAAFKDSDTNDLSATKTFIDASLEQLDAMTAELSQKIGDTGSAPDLNALRTTLQEMKKIMDTQLADRPGEGETQAQGSTGAVEEASATTIAPASAMNAVNSRQDVIRLIDLICNYYDRSEPGSPVPLILKRARQLVDKNFIEILEDLTPDTAGKMKTLISGAEK